MQIRSTSCVLNYALFIVNPQLQISTPFSISHPISSSCLQLLSHVLVGRRRPQRDALSLCSAPAHQWMGCVGAKAGGALADGGSKLSAGCRSAVLPLPYQSSPSAKLLAQDKFHKCNQFGQTVMAIPTDGVGFLSVPSNFTS